VLAILVAVCGFLSSTAVEVAARADPPVNSALPPRLPVAARELLVHIDDSQWEQIVDRQPLDGSDEETLVQMLYRLPALRLDEVELLTRASVPWNELAETPKRHRVEFFRLSGQATHVVRVPLIPEIIERVEYDHYYRVTFQLDDAPNPILVCARQVPQAWPLNQPLQERAGLDGLFFKVGEADGPHPQLIFAADRVAWYPQRASAEFRTSSPQVLLADLGFDVGLLDDVRVTNGRGITARDRECFYQMLSAVGKAEPARLSSPAEAELALTSLLQEPHVHHGQLTTVRGVARRITKILVDDPDIRQRFQIDHYYQLDVFVPLGEQLIRIEASPSSGDGPVYANNYPVTVCARRLPPGLEETPNSRHVVRIPAFFFKLWAYKSEYTRGFDKSLTQPSPMFIALEPQIVPQQPVSNPVSRFVVVMLILTLGGFGLGLWCYGRRSSQADRAKLFRRHALEPGRSLDEMNLASRDQPDFSGLD